MGVVFELSAERIIVKLYSARDGRSGSSWRGGSMSNASCAHVYVIYRRAVEANGGGGGVVDSVHRDTCRRP